MNAKEFLLNDHKVLVVDAPDNATHSVVAVVDGANFIIYRKKKVLCFHTFNESKTDEELAVEYYGRVSNVGALKTATDGQLGELFNTVKHGNFYDYEYNGVFYPSAVSALKDIVDQELNFSNPYVLIIKPN